MVWRISAGLGPEDPAAAADPGAPGDAAGPGMPPYGPLLASVVRRGGGLSRNWGARLACLTRRGRPLRSRSVPGPFGPPDLEGPAGAAEPGISDSGPVSREISHGGPEACPGRGGPTGVIGVAGPPGPGAAGPADGPGLLCRVQPGNGAVWSGYGAAPPEKGAAGAVPGNGAWSWPG